MNFSTATLQDYLKARSEQIERIIRLADRLNETYVEKLGEVIMTYESKVADVIEGIAADPAAGGAELEAAVAERLPEEQRIIAERREELREKLIPEIQQKADELVQESQKLKKARHTYNKKSHEKQEKLEAQYTKLEARLAELNTEIQETSRALGLFRHPIKMYKLIKERRAIYHNLEDTAEALKSLRDDWQKKKALTDKKETKLEAEWREALLQRSHYQTELEGLDVPEQRESLARKRAIRYVLDRLREPVSAPNPDFEEKVNELVELNVRRDAYEAATAKSGHLAALHRGVKQGMQGIQKSVEQLRAQERKYSAHLPKLNFSVSDEVIHHQTTLWSALEEKLEGQSYYSEHPFIFVQVARNVIEDHLNDDKIQWIFEELGNALERATQRWK